MGAPSTGQAHTLEEGRPASRTPNMKISGIRLHLVEARLPEPQGNASQFIDRRAALLVEVRSDEGLGGWGETWHSPPAAWTIIETALAPAILGQDPMEYQRLWAAMHERLGYERQGPGLMALSAVDMAIWDLRGRALGSRSAACSAARSAPGCRPTRAGPTSGRAATRTGPTVARPSGSSRPASGP